MKIIRNAIQCKTRGEIIKSKDTNDFVQCRIDEYAVDGGHEHLKRCLSPDRKGFTDLSKTTEE